MNRHFYRPLEENATYMNDSRGYLSPYLDAELEGEIESRVLMARYMRLKNQTNHLFKTRCTGVEYRGLF